MISYYAEQIKVPPLEKRKINQWLKAIAHKYDRNIGEIAYIFCNDEKILEVNKTYLKHDYYTDIITFDYCEKKQLSGDIFISLDTVASNAQTYKVSFENELKRVLAHGLLHLCGQDDQTDTLRAEMIAKENDALQLWDSLFNTNNQSPVENI